MDFDHFDKEQFFHAVWETIRIERGVKQGLFTFGESQLPYFLVLDSMEEGKTVSISQGEVRITRPTIITPETSHPEFQNFFENQQEEGMVEFLIARTAGFSHLKFHNQKKGDAKIVSDSVEEAVAKLNKQLDKEDEESVAILSAPADFAGLAIFKYAADRVVESTPGNVQELRERGFLP
ncbi:hypothetical protein MNBD_PLANCTO02-2481 [hydrothermal vent metagenome]|uniref:Uncharacterized protein n=1 Tax=hydrothermal vent metagenome TaxID=652676 RepID=A0A3B1DC50_9ZZZZ